MKKVILASLLAITISGCTFYSTDKASAVDDRPTISIQTPFADAPVYVDGQLVGTAGQFKANVAGIRVLPGTHVIQVNVPNKEPVVQKVYVSSGVNKVLVAQ